MVNQLAEVRNNIGEGLGRRSTEQRQLILKIIQRADTHVDADQIYEQARHKLPGISLSTVYRNLHLFKDWGVVKEHQFDSKRRSYESTPKSKHQHLVCLGCGMVFQFKCPLAESIKDKIGAEEGFKVTDANVHLTGYCPDCQRRLRGNDGRIKGDSD